MRGLAADAAQRAPIVRVAGEPTPDMAVGDERWKLPPSLGAMLRPLETLHRPNGALYRAYTEPSGAAGDGAGAYRFGPNRIDVAGAPVDVGFSIDLTIDPRLQALAQQTAACYTGRGDICRALEMRRKEDAGAAFGHRMLEHAVVRMAAIAIVDVETGRIEALAGALSPCTREEYDGPGRSARCDQRMPYPIRYRPDALLNPAVFHDAMPASTIKPIMAAAFLTDSIVGARWLAAERAQANGSPGVPRADTLRGQLMRSNSARFLDRMFCADTAFAPCARPWSVRDMARAFGWNEGCDAPRETCGKRDLLFGRAVDASGASGAVQPIGLVVPFGRLLTEPLGGRPGASFRLRADTPLDPAKVRRCAAGADGARLTSDDWEKCGGGAIVDVVAEGWGQGHARASALGAAGMMAVLASAANGQSRVPRPHLVERLRGAGVDAQLKPAVLRWSLAEAAANPLPREVADVVIGALSYSHRAGTARLACEQVFDARICRDIDWIAGKTGTPTFPNDDRSLDELARLCATRVARTKTERAACGPLRPYKWYVAAYRGDPSDARWTKVIAVLTERNWLADTGRIHGAGDHGPNPAAEIAMQIAGRDVGAIRRSGE
jgi:cell division protein FtsI/penicillin-binding protein 2